MSERRARESGPKKDPRTGTWGFVADIGTDSTGKRKQARRRGFATKKDAQAALDALRSDIREHTYVARIRVTVNEYLDDWLELVAGDLQSSTLSSYKRVLRLHVRPGIGGLQLQALTPAALNHLYAELRERLSPRSVRYAHTIVRAALQEAVRSGRVVRNVADAARPPKAKEARAREMTTWSAPEVGLFFARDDVKAHRHHVAWWVAVLTGLRRGELLGLRWRDLDLDAGQLTVAQVCIAVEHVVQLVPGTKTGRGRTIEIDDATAVELKRHKVAQARELFSLGIRQGDASLVFARPDGTPLDPDRFGETFTRFVERRPVVPRIRFHDLRHTYASLALRAGVPLTVVSRHLGHSSITVTADVYQHVSGEMHADAAERVASLIRSASVTKL